MNSPTKYTTVEANPRPMQTISRGTNHAHQGIQKLLLSLIVGTRLEVVDDSGSDKPDEQDDDDTDKDLEDNHDTIP